MRASVLFLLALAACSAQPDAEGRTPEAASASDAGPEQVVTAYYDALSQQDYETAWQLWGKDPLADPEEYETFVEGFEKTELAIADVGEAREPERRGGWITVEVPVHVEDLKSDGTGDSYGGVYSLRRRDAENGGWYIYRGNLDIDGQ